MRICYLANAESIHTQKWVKYFADRGHEIHLISTGLPGDDHLQNVNLYLLKLFRGMKGVNHPYSIFQIRRVMKKINPDILHAHLVVDFGFWGALSGFHPFVVTAWGSDILVRPQKSKLARWMVEFTLKQANLITCDAEHLIDSMVKLGADKDKIKLIYFGVDTEKFDPKQKDVRFKEKLHLKPSSLTIISLRNLSPIYDVESLIKAIPLVLAKIPDAEFIIVGDGEQRSYLENLTASLGVSGNVRFSGRIPNDELPRYLTSADIYVSTSLSDGGLAASTAEAMACELPVVITDFGNNRDWVKDGEGGFIIPTKRPVILAERIVYLLKNEDVRRRFGQINRKVIKERNNYQKEMKLVQNIYTQLVGNLPKKK